MLNEPLETSYGYLLDPCFQLTDQSGKPIYLGYIECYLHGSRNKYYCYSDFDGTKHPFQIPINSLGTNIVLADVGVPLDVYVYNRFGNLEMSRYNVVAGSGVAGGGGGTPADPIDAQYWLGNDGETVSVRGGDSGRDLPLPTSPDSNEGFVRYIQSNHIVVSEGIYLVQAVVDFRQDYQDIENTIENLKITTGLSDTEDVVFERDEAGHDASDNIHSLKVSFIRHAVEGTTDDICIHVISPVDLQLANIRKLSIVKLQTAGYGSDPQPLPSNVLTESDLGLNQSSQIVSIRNYPIASAGGLPAIPQYTVRLQFVRGYIPSGDSKFSYSLVSSEENIWDITKVYDPTDFSSFLSQSTFWDGEVSSIVAAYVKRVVGVNSTGVTKFNNMFSGCTNFINEYVPMDTTSGTEFRALFYNCQNLIYLPDYFIDTQNGTDLSYMLSHTGLLNAPMLNTSSATTMRDFLNSSRIKRSPLYDTSNATDLGYMFNSCSNLVEVPLLDTSSCTDMHNMFNTCRNVESGALALYQQASTQSTEVTDHGGTFYNCGRDTVTGRAELDQIPADWKAYG